MSIIGWLLLGAASWLAAVVLKVVADVIVQRTVRVAFQDWLASLLSGVWSSVCEIGLAVLAFWHWNARFSDALIMAAGAAIAEFVIILPAAISAKFETKPKQSKAKETANWNAFFTERTVLFVNHLTSRALAWLGIAGTGGMAALASAFSLFAATETIQAYAQAKEWDWLNNRTLWTFLAFQIGVVLLQIALIFLWWR